MSGSWQDAPYVFIALPSCPSCGSLKPIIVRSESNGDNSTTRKCVCRSCSKRFLIVTEPPDDALPKFGMDDHDV